MKTLFSIVLMLAIVSISCEKEEEPTLTGNWDVVLQFPAPRVLLGSEYATNKLVEFRLSNVDKLTLHLTQKETMITGTMGTMVAGKLNTKPLGFYSHIFDPTVQIQLDVDPGHLVIFLEGLVINDYKNMQGSIKVRENKIGTWSANKL